MKFSASKETDRREWRQRIRRAAANFHQVFDRVCRSTGRDLSIDRSATGQSPLDERIRRSLVRDNRESEENWIDGWINRYLHTILRKIESFFFFSFLSPFKSTVIIKTYFFLLSSIMDGIVSRNLLLWIRVLEEVHCAVIFFFFLYYQQVRLGSLKFYFYHLFQRIFGTSNVKKKYCEHSFFRMNFSIRNIGKKIIILVLRRNYLLSKHIIIYSLKILKKFYHEEKNIFF